MAPLDPSATKLRHILGVPPNRISEIVRGCRGISGDTALGLARYFGVSAQGGVRSHSAKSHRLGF